MIYADRWVVLDFICYGLIALALGIGIGWALS